MHIQDIILLVVASEKDRGLQGRTILQKKLYFISVLNKTDHTTNFGFSPHYYGPFSREVAENLDLLVSCGFLNQVTETFSTDRNILGEIRRHTYYLTPDGDAVMGEITKQDECASWQQALNDLNSQPSAGDFNTLSIAAKVHYIVKQQGRVTRRQIRETAGDYGWDIYENDVNNVLSFLENLSLVSRR